MNKIVYMTILLAVLLSLTVCSISRSVTPTTAPTTPSIGLANPASAFCIEKGGQVNIVTDASGGQSGVCVFPDGSRCEEWAFYRGQCVPLKLLTLDALKNAEYQIDLQPARKVRLTNGEYRENKPPNLLYVTLAPPVAWGDLNGDGAEDAAAVIAYNTGGSGTFEYLVAVINQTGLPRHTASAELGDRIIVEAISIKAGVITVNMIAHGPQDPMCCPTQKVAHSFKLEGGKLIMVASP